MGEKELAELGSAEKSVGGNGNGRLSIERYFSKSGADPYDSVQWGHRDVNITDQNSGRKIYDGKNVEFPVSWSDTAVKVVGSKYFFKGDGTHYVENSLRGLIGRVTEELANEGRSQGIFSSDKEATNFRDDLVYLDLHQTHSFNSPVWFNVGLYNKYGVKESSTGSFHWAINDQGRFSQDIDSYQRPQAAACFIQSIEDSMESILEHASREGMLFKLGSGTGTNFSTLRGVNEPLSGGGFASGMGSFMRIYDIIAGRIQSGGKTRRAAKMVICDCDHPDLLRFIHWKVNEEKKALWLSANPLWGPHNKGDLESEAYKTVDGQNGNNSVRVSDKFMRAALSGDEWDLIFRTAYKSGEEREIPLDQYRDDRYLPDKRFVRRVTNKRKTINASEALEQIARAATVIGDPALQYDDNINRWNTCPNSGRINASNPCSEFMFLDDSACNLASINLTKFKGKEGQIVDKDSLRNAVRVSVYAQEILVDYASYPSRQIAENSHRFRPLGLGYTNLGALLMERGIAYDSDEGRAITSAVTSLMTAYAYQTSAELASKRGPFEEFSKNKEPMLNVMKMHRDHTERIQRTSNVSGLESLVEEAKKAWDDVIEKGDQYGFRNSQTTLIAPTGTIGFMMDVDCTGIEPMLGLKTFKGLAGGGGLEREVASCVENGLKALGYSGTNLENILDYINREGTVIGAPGLEKDHYRVFATSFGDNTIPVEGHLKMMAAVQPFISGAISKTVNLPKGSGVEDVKKTYIKGWEMGLKSVSLYIDGSKGVQPVNIIQNQNGSNTLKWGERDKPRNPTERAGWNVDIGNTGVHIIIGEYDNRPATDALADVFVEFGSAGSPFSAVFEAWAKEASRNRQRGMPLREFIKHNRGSTDPIHGFTNNPLIKSASGIQDYIAKLVQLEYLGDTSVCDVEPTQKQIAALRCNVLGQRRREDHFKSRIDFIDSVIMEGEITPIVPLFEEEIKEGDIPLGQVFCVECGSPTLLSGANCRKCPNCGSAGGCG